MNRIQSAIAGVLGVDEELDVTNRALEAIASDYTLLERRLEDVDYLNLWDTATEREIIKNVNDAKTLRRLRTLRHDNPLAKQGVKLIVRFTLGKGIQWIVKEAQRADKVMATGADVPDDDDDQQRPEPPVRAERPQSDRIIEFPRRRASEDIIDEHSEIRDVLDEIWGDEENQLTLLSHPAQQQWLDENVTDGEKFLAIFESEGVAPYIRLSEIPVEEVKDILYDPENRKRPVWYKRVFQELVYDAQNDTWKPKNSDLKPTTKYYRDFRVSDEALERIEAAGLRIPAGKVGEGKIQHWMINPLDTKAGKRGISELYASREWFRVFREFMQDRAAINAAATAIAYKRKVKGGPADVAKFKNRFGGIETGGQSELNPDGAAVRRLTRPVAGATYDSNEAADLEWNKTDTGASNAKEDARMLLMSAGAGMATSIHYFGEGGDANLATAQAMELPMVKSYEDWQKYWETNMMSLMYYGIKVAFGADYKIPKDVLVWEFPPIISKDIVKVMTAWSTLSNQIAKDDIFVKKIAIRGALMDMDVPGVDQIMKEVEAEEDRLMQEKEEQRQRQLEAFERNGINPNAPPGDKTPVPGFAKAQAAGGGDPDLARAQKGKPPVDRRGRLSDLNGGNRR